MHRDELIEQITRLAKADSRVLGLFLTGSLGAGTGDPWSDVDTVFVVTPSDHGAFVAELRDWVSQVAVPLIWRQVYPPHPLFHTVLPNWLRLDMTITTPEHLIGTQAGARALHDPQGLFQRLPAALDPRRPDPARVAYLIEEFLRVIALPRLVVLGVIIRIDFGRFILERSAAGHAVDIASSSIEGRVQLAAAKVALAACDRILMPVAQETRDVALAVGKICAH